MLWGGGGVCSWKPEEGIWFSGGAVTSSCKLLNMGAGNRTQKQKHVPLTTEQPCQPAFQSFRNTF